MIHLCTIATLMFLQNNTSQKILFIAARTIQFPGVVFKVCIYLIVAIVTSSIYFDVKSTHTYRKYIYQQSFQCIVNIYPLIFFQPVSNSFWFASESAQMALERNLRELTIYERVSKPYLKLYYISHSTDIMKLSIMMKILPIMFNGIDDYNPPSTYNIKQHSKLQHPIGLHQMAWEWSYRNNWT